MHEGDRISADALLVECVHLSVDESLLTGEAMPVLKSTDDGHCEVYSGTLAVQGSAFAIVSATGMNTRFGQIGHSLQSIADEEPRLQKEMKRFIRNLSIITLVIIGIATSLLLATLAIPGLNSIFNFEYPGLTHFVPAIIAASVMLLILEALKWHTNRRLV